jgi:hypothetical protein
MIYMVTEEKHNLQSSSEFFIILVLFEESGRKENIWKPNLLIFRDSSDS